MRSAGFLSKGALAGLRLLCVMFFASLLGACASLLPPAERGWMPKRDQVQSFALEGRFSLRHADKNTAGNLSWRHVGARDDLLLASPFGQGVAEIVSDGAGVRLTTSDGKSYLAADAETLTQQVLGYPLPLKNLLGWVRGDAAGGELEARDVFARPLRLRHGDWRIDYEYDNDDPQAMPGRLFVQRERVLELRLRIDEWRNLSEEDGRP
jgi:outer membrane lipoprotein LolB